MQNCAVNSVLAIPSVSQAQQGATIATKVNIVSFLATVHDRDGKVVENLNPDDFVLLDDGIPQKIDFFSRESDLPLTIGLWSTPAGARWASSKKSAGPVIYFWIKCCGRTRIGHSSFGSTLRSNCCGD
jgi:hypothetical protein